MRFPQARSSIRGNDPHKTLPTIFFQAREVHHINLWQWISKNWRDILVTLATAKGGKRVIYADQILQQQDHPKPRSKLPVQPERLKEMMIWWEQLSWFRFWRTSCSWRIFKGLPSLNAFIHMPYSFRIVLISQRKYVSAVILYFASLHKNSFKPKLLTLFWTMRSLLHRRVVVLWSRKAFEDARNNVLATPGAPLSLRTWVMREDWELNRAGVSILWNYNSEVTRRREHAWSIRHFKKWKALASLPS